VEGGNGIFDVLADDELLFSKGRAGRFPEHSEILDALRTRTSS
jgi:predicted Rdx family selenoprotein